MRFTPWMATFGLGLELIAGCSRSPQFATVSGKVTLNGEPLPNVGLIFQPLNSGVSQVPATSTKGTKNDKNLMASYGQTDSNGKFTLKFSDNSRAGALVGEHSVTIVEKTESSDAKDDQPTVAPIPVKGTKPTTPAKVLRVPKKWSDGTEHFTVKMGGNDASFELSK